MSSILDIQADDWEREITQEKRPVVVEFWHHKCVVCKEMKPIFEEQPKKYGESVKFTKMNLLESKENRVFAIRNGVRSTPTFIVYCEGRPIGQIIGYREPEEFTKELKMIIDHTDSCMRATPIEE
ncbi:MAG: thioredoxin family protein [Candidatus Bathyarchaeota archaeon]